MAERRPGELRRPTMCNDKTKELRENESSSDTPHGSRTDVASDMHTHVLHRGGKDGFGKHGEDSVEFRAQLHVAPAFDPRSRIDLGFTVLSNVE